MQPFGDRIGDKSAGLLPELGVLVKDAKAF
jgi:hypothetical protein